MTDEPKSPSEAGPSQPRRHRPRMTELSRETTEEDLWNLDDDEKSVAATPIEPRKPKPEATELAVADEVPADPSVATGGIELTGPGLVESVPTDAKISETKPAEAEARKERPPVPRLRVPAFERDSTSTEDPDLSDEPKEGLLKIVDVRELAEKVSSANRKELIGLGVLAAVFLGLAIWWIVGQFSSLPTTDYRSDLPEFPAKGKYGEVRDAETYWRKPIRDGENPDVAGSEVMYIPVLSVRISGNSGTGVLRAIFRDQAGAFVGDGIARRFEGGRFLDTGGDSVEFPATDGFQADSDFNGYRVGNDRWTVEILEGPSANATGDEFHSLFTAPISSTRN